MKFKLVKEGRRDRELGKLRGWRNPDDRAVSKHILEQVSWKSRRW